ncbi:MAG: NifB/NifX family molybdenum-iron cluster-binding protein [Candidatus Omnitrophica bacterium]|nr:NifB/NifX family molybdenum-iron cluster-binding protein [Candidatus Omnitrophota bacterium]
MKIAIPSEGRDINSQISKVFARAPYLLIYDSDDNTYVALENLGEDIAGPATAKRVIELGVEKVIVDRIGSYALDTLNGNGILVIGGARGSVWNAIVKHVR